MTRARWLLSIVPALFACNPTEAPPDAGKLLPTCLDPTPRTDGESITMGRTKNNVFQPIEEGARVPLEFGAQGAQHIFLAVQFYADAGVMWRHYFTLTSTTDGMVGLRDYVHPCCAPGTNEAPNVLLVVSTATPTVGLLSLESSPLDADGAPMRTLTATRTIVLFVNK